MRPTNLCEAIIASKANRRVFAHDVHRWGPIKPLMFSLFPENADPLIEQDHMIYGRVANLEAVAIPYYETYSTPFEIEGL